jgi:hypothetical protein
MARKCRKAPKIELHPMFLWIRGKMGKIVYHLTRNGEVSAHPAPDIRPIYLEMAAKSKRSKGRPFDMALSDYFQGNDLLWQKLYDDQPKPDDWRW